MYKGGAADSSPQQQFKDQGGEEAVLSPQPQIPESMNLIDFSLEDVTFTELPDEALALGPSAANPCPGFSAIPEIGDLIDFHAEEEQPSEPPVEELASG